MPDVDYNKDAAGVELEYEGFPFVSNVDDYIQNELSARSQQRVRAITPYIKVTPGFSTDGTANGKIILKGIEAPTNVNPAEYQFKDLYRADAFMRPLAGIKSLTVDYKNAYGSTRKATLTWICHTVEDLERLSPYFLNPGYTLFIEWGWSDMANIMNTNDPQVNLETAFSYGKAGQFLTNGNYDCMLGVITNYNFSLNRDGGFDCTTEIISAGYLLEGLTTPNQFSTDYLDAKKRELMMPKEDGTPGMTEEDAEKEVKRLEKNIDLQEKNRLQSLEYFLKYQFYRQISTQYETYKNMTDGIDDKFIYAPDTSEIAKLHRTSPAESKSTEYSVEAKSIDEEGDEKMEDVDVEIIDRPAVYATWGYIEDEILNKYATNIVTIDGKKSLFNFDSRKSRVVFHDNLRTTDLGICLLPKINGGADGKHSLPVPPFKRKGDESSADGYNYGEIRRILVNLDWFREVMLNSTTVLEGVLQIWSGINDACINYWNFKLKINDQFYTTTGEAIQKYYSKDNTNSNTDTGEMASVYSIPLVYSQDEIKRRIDELNQDRVAIVKYSIIDAMYINNVTAESLIKNQGVIYMFRTKTFTLPDSNTKYTSVLKNINFQSSLSSQAALNVFYSAQNVDGNIVGSPKSNTFRSLYDFKDDNGVKLNVLKDTFMVNKFRLDSPPPSEDDTTDVDAGTKDEVEIKAQFRAYPQQLWYFLPTRRTGYWAAIMSGDKQIIFSGIEGMKSAILLKDGAYKPVQSTALVPLNCEIELEGISGLRIGNVFTLDHIPTIYRNNGLFQIIGLTDTIDKNSWTTKIKSQFRVVKDVDYPSIQSGRNIPVNEDRVYRPNTNITVDEIKALADDPAPKINTSKVGSAAATYTPVYMSRGLNVRDYSDNQIINLIKNGTLVEIGDSSKNPNRFSPNSSSPRKLPVPYKGKYYLERKAAQQFKLWYDEMVQSKINFTVSSAMRYGADTGAGPHGYGIAIDFSNLYGAVGGNTTPKANLIGRINTKDYAKIAEIGKKYGWYNPWRLSDVSGKQDEMWHFEYWGSA